MSKEIIKLQQLGQSFWYDNIERKLLENGELNKMIVEGDIFGVTSNPTIFQKAIANSNDYDKELKNLAAKGLQPIEIFYELAVEDIQRAADLFKPVYESTNKKDGYVSLEVNPLLANKTQETIDEALWLWEKVNRPNLMIKIPATPEGIPAIKAAISKGINVNVTLIFSRTRYAEVIDAYISGLEERAEKGLPIDQIASVASFFVSRFDSKVDGKLMKLANNSVEKTELAKTLLGKTAIANTRLAYNLFAEKFYSARFKKLQEKGAGYQRPLWASTSTKNPEYSDILYVDSLTGEHTVNTLPPNTLEAFKNHGKAALALVGKETESSEILAKLESLGISVDQVTKELEEEGVASFSASFNSLLETIAARS